MLKKLYVKNFVLLDELELSFRPGLNIITGETGAGKSILIGALGGLLGDRLNKDIVRSGADKAILEAEFAFQDAAAVHDFLKSNEIEDDADTVVLRREMSAAGKGRCFINDQPVAVSVLERMGDLLVDLHGQHEHQLLLQPQHHAEYLDSYLGLDAQLTTLRSALEHFNSLLRKMSETRTRAESLRKTRDYLQFQVAEINAVDPIHDEDEALRQEENILKHSESIFEKTRKLYLDLYEAEGSVSEVLAGSENCLKDLLTIDPRFQSMADDCRNARLLIDELASGLRQYHDTISVDPDKLEKIRMRLSSLAGLKKKYGGTLENVLQHRVQIRSELELVDNLDETLQEMQKQIEQEREHLGRLCRDITQKRSSAISAFNEQVAAILAKLGMEKAVFDIALHRQEGHEEPFVYMDERPARVTANGAEQVEFLIAPNPGEGFKPLADAASGGEISRVMLALKTMLAEVDRVPVLVFDEIDIGISGRIAFAVGRSLRILSKKHQILCITHLPQIAGMGHWHFLVEKTGDDKTTRTRVRVLPEKERVDQIARLLGGETLTAASRQSARELLEEAEKIV